jgi:hypothetical protein
MHCWEFRAPQIQHHRMHCWQFRALQIRHHPMRRRQTQPPQFRHRPMNCWQIQTPQIEASQTQAPPARRAGRQQPVQPLRSRPPSFR